MQTSVAAIQTAAAPPAPLAPAFDDVSQRLHHSSMLTSLFLGWSIRCCCCGRMLCSQGPCPPHVPPGHPPPARALAMCSNRGLSRLHFVLEAGCKNRQLPSRAAALAGSSAGWPHLLDIFLQANCRQHLRSHAQQLQAEKVAHCAGGWAPIQDLQQQGQQGVPELCLRLHTYESRHCRGPCPCVVAQHLQQSAISSLVRRDSPCPCSSSVEGTPGLQRRQHWQASSSC